MNNTAIRVNTLSKCYHIYDRPQDRLKQLIVPKLRSLIGRTANSYYREFQALNNVSFEVNKGETVGIIGRNGSGKSTLLQMICGTLEPTHGSVETTGRVAALLELGAGFNPEFTGRENIYMNAAVLGLTQDEIHNRFDAIAAFADIGEFIEQPVKHYSSGMYARLAFAVAINVDPSILIVDEALAVGDEPFQRKCFARIEQIKRNGATILFVSHSSGAITSLCDRAILLHNGSMIFSGMPKIAVAWYQKLMNAPEKSDEVIQQILSSYSSEIDLSEPIEALHAPNKSALIAHEESSYDPNFTPKSKIIYETNGAVISDVSIQSLDGRTVNSLSKGQKFKICYRVAFERSCENVHLRCMLKTTIGLELGGGIYPKNSDKGLSFSRGQTIDVSFEFTCILNPGVYFINCGLSENDRSLHRIVDALSFRVFENGNSFTFGLVDFGFTPNIEFSSDRDTNEE